MAAGTKVYALGEFTSKLAASYLSHIAAREDTEESTRKSLQEALKTADLPASTNIVHNLLRAIEEHRKEIGRKTDGSPVSWGEFCACCIDLATHEQKSTPQVSAPPSGKGTDTSKLSPTSKHEVFLGGSCNPTTWRKDLAIPALSKAGVTYFNPQVDEWYPELIDIEEQAKTSAFLLLFVVDNKTRAISSMVEIAYLTGQGQNVVSIVEDILPGQTLAGETVSAREIEDLNRGRLFVRNLVEEGGCYLADSLHDALTSSMQIVKEKLCVREYCSRTTARKMCYVPPSLGEQLHLLHRVFTMYDNGKKNILTLSEADLALRSLHVESPTLQELLTAYQISSPQSETDELLQQYKSQGLTFSDFCSVYTELKYIMLQADKSSSILSGYLFTPLRWIASWLWRAPATPTSSLTPFVDVFLNGSCGSTTWRADVSIPILKQYGVSYFNPQVANWDRRLLPIEREAKERCSVLLYVVTGETLSVASLVEAAYYIGKGRSVVLCVSDITSQGGDTTTVEGMKLGARAVKDYNRGRAYLIAMANKSRVPVYTSVATATMTAVQLSLCMRGQKKQPSLYLHSNISTSV